jgi:hypothetical protein
MVMKTGHLGNWIEHLECFEPWCWRKMETIIRNGRLNIEVVLCIHKGDSNIILIIKMSNNQYFSYFVNELSFKTNFEGNKKNC